MTVDLSLQVLHGEIWQVLFCGILTGAGIGLAFGAMPSASIAVLPPEAITSTRHPVGRR